MEGEFKPRKTLCTSNQLKKDLRMFIEYPFYPNEWRDSFIFYIMDFGYRSLNKTPLYSCSYNQLQSTTIYIYDSICKRLGKYINNLEKVLSSWWNLEDEDIGIILSINEKLSEGLWDEEILEERLYIQLEHLDECYPLKELFYVLSNRDKILDKLNLIEDKQKISRNKGEMLNLEWA